jgi:hypothetical protein
MTMMTIDSQKCLSVTILGLAFCGSIAPLVSEAGTHVAELKQMYGSSLRVAGLIERIDPKSNTIFISGQTVLFDGSTKVAEGGKKQRALESLHGVIPLKTGDYVAVSGDLDSVASAITKIADQYDFRAWSSHFRRLDHWSRKIGLLGR